MPEWEYRTQLPSGTATQADTLHFCVIDSSRGTVLSSDSIHILNKNEEK